MEAKMLTSICSFLSIFLVMYVGPIASIKLQPNYDDKEHESKSFDIRSQLTLHCGAADTTDYTLSWKKDNEDVAKVKQLEGRYRILAAEKKFIIDKTENDDHGVYSCEFGSDKKDINVFARVAVRVPSNTAVVEGEKLTITCNVVGTRPKLYWRLGEKNITNSTEQYILKADDKGVDNAVFVIEDVKLNDHGEYKCIARNDDEEYGANFPEASDTSLVRVKGKFAAVWPFLGICAEVLILCAIILIYEKRRNKGELVESDTDPQEQ